MLICQDAMSNLENFSQFDIKAQIDSLVPVCRYCDINLTNHRFITQQSDVLLPGYIPKIVDASTNSP
jgi:hypothetical protein